MLNFSDKTGLFLVTLKGKRSKQVKSYCIFIIIREKLLTKSKDYNIINSADFSIYGGIAQLARAFGSYPKCRRFKSYFRYQRPGGQAVKTPPFHGGNTSSILVRVTTPPVSWQGLCFRNKANAENPGDFREIRRCGGIGRHKGLKIPRSNIRTGSSPVTGTKKGSFLTVFFCCLSCLKRLKT